MNEYGLCQMELHWKMGLKKFHYFWKIDSMRNIRSRARWLLAWWDKAIRETALNRCHTGFCHAVLNFIFFILFSFLVGCAVLAIDLYKWHSLFWFGCQVCLFFFGSLLPVCACIFQYFNKARGHQACFSAFAVLFYLGAGDWPPGCL